MAPNNASRQRYSLIVAAVVVIAVVVAVWLWVRADRPRAGSATTPSNPAPASSDSPPTTTTPPGFAYQPLWPFADTKAASAWEVAYGEGGLQPWHLDPGMTAQYFAQHYLGYAGIDKVVSTSVRGDEAWIGVGFGQPGGATVTAAVVHLVRFGPPPDAPWEVVGTQDSTLSVTAPAYGAAASSPLTVGGRVTGVDENLRVQVRSMGRQQQPVGEGPAIAGGGTDAQWSTTVPLGACSGTLTVAVAAGGHIAEVERFAMTGVHC
ncbi:hypothetical protein [Nocardia sp. NPDC051570]|uniref:hypothetical protein n=1 Tax=Nocardia sp. NPDC051570 TaxID=3364324 RepID=UPI0037A7E6F1